MSSVGAQNNRSATDKSTQQVSSSSKFSGPPNSSSSSSSAVHAHPAPASTSTTLREDASIVDVRCSKSASSGFGSACGGEDDCASLFDPKWRPRFGLKIRLPIQLPDDILQRISSHLHTFFGETQAKSAEGEETKTSELSDESSALHLAQSLKHMLDEQFGRYWHVIVGRDFGSLITHQSQQFVYFMYDSWSYMIFKIG